MQRQRRLLALALRPAALRRERRASARQVRQDAAERVQPDCHQQYQLRCSGWSRTRPAVVAEAVPALSALESRPEAAEAAEAAVGAAAVACAGAATSRVRNHGISDNRVHHYRVRCSRSDDNGVSNRKNNRAWCCGATRHTGDRAAAGLALYASQVTWQRPEHEQDCDHRSADSRRQRGPTMPGEPLHCLVHA